MNEKEFVERVNWGRIKGGGVRGRPPGKWMSRVRKYWDLESWK